MGATFLAATGALAGFQASRTVSCPISVTKGFDWGNLGGTKNKAVVTLRKAANFLPSVITITVVN